MPDNFLPLLSSQLLSQSPLIVLFLIGLICAFVFHSRCPRPATLLIIGLVATLLAILGGTLLNAWLFAARESLGLSMSEFSIYMGVIGFFRVLLSTIGQILMIVAVFSGRKSS